MMKPFFLVLLIPLIYSNPILAEIADDEQELSFTKNAGHQSAKKLGLVLSGGGARGMAHVGVLKRLEELRVPIDYISGTSMGGIVAGLYASGMSATEIEKIMIEHDWLAVFSDDTSRKNRSIQRKKDDAYYSIKSAVGFNSFKFTFPKGIIEGQKISLLIRQLVTPVAYIKDFDNFEIPLRIIATNIENGEQVVLKNGNLSDAIKASMSIPGVFSPVEINGELLIDGGLRNNLPVDTVRRLGAERIIAVNVSTPLLTQEQLKSVLDISGQVSGLRIYDNTKKSIESLHKSDILITPQLKDFSFSDFLKAEELIELGYESALEQSAVLKQYSISESEYQAYRKRLSQQRQLKTHIDTIRIINDSPLNDKVIHEYLGLNEGDDLNEPDIRRAINRLYGLGYFDRITYNIEYGERTTLVVTVVQRSWGPGYLNFGILVRGSAFTSSNSLNVRAGYTRTLVNSLGGEWASVVQIGTQPQLRSRFYQPLDYGLRYFIEPEIFYGTKNYYFYKGGEREAEYQSRKTEVNLEFGRELKEWGRISFTLGHARGQSVNVIGDVIKNEDETEFSEDFLGAYFRLDRLDNIHFPTEGYFGTFKYTEYFTEKESEDYTQVKAKYLHAFDFNRNTLVARFTLNYSADDIAPLQNKFRAGGFLNMSGFSEDELIGVTYYQAMLVYLRKVTIFPLFPVYVGASAEAGNMWQQTSSRTLADTLYAGSVFMGVDSFVGPIYVGAGYAQGGHMALYVSFGYGFFLK